MTYDRTELSNNEKKGYVRLIRTEPPFNISNSVINFSNFIKNPRREYLYNGSEKIPFRKRHPIFKSLMTIEFEDVMREYIKSLNVDRK